jgi:hypothetical protein
MKLWNSLRVARSHPRRTLFLAAALVGLSASAARAEIIRVGTAAACDEDTLPLALLRAALNGDAADEVRVPRDTTYSNVAIHLTDWDPATAGALTIVGGYDSCADTTINGVTTFNGAASSPVIEVDTASRPVSEVTLRALELKGGSLGLLAEGGADVLIQGSMIRLNDGGIEVASGADVELNPATDVMENSGTSFGGGVRCHGVGSLLVVAGEIWNNTATVSGGGIHANTGCVVAFRAGALIEGNQANLGGGLYIAGGARAENLGTGSAGVDIYSNTAFSEGGGIYMVGPGPQTLLGNARIVSNEAGQRGGGVALIGGARLQLERFNFEQCLTSPRCVKINENLVITGGVGSAVYADGGSEFRMFQGYLESNNDSEFAGFAIFATGTDTTMLFEGVQIAHNSTVALFQAEAGAKITAAFVSAAGNNYEVSGGPTVLDSRGGQAIGGATIELYSSILVDQRPFVTSTGGAIHGDCLLLDTISGLTSQFASQVGLDPRFVDAGAGDLHLQRDSPAIDACDAAAYTPVDADADLDARGYDFTSQPDFVGPFDRGFDELRPLFADGFESGDTSAWSLAIP